MPTLDCTNGLDYYFGRLLLEEDSPLGESRLLEEDDGQMFLNEV